MPLQHLIEHHASTAGVISFAKQACSGLLLEEELESLNKLNQNENRPSVAVLGGAKISTKLGFNQFSF